MLLDVENLSAAHPTKPLFDSLSFTVTAGDVVGVVGVNGSGKSTLLRMLAGVEEPHGGVIRRRSDLRVATMWQRPDHEGRSAQDLLGDHWRAAATIDRLGLTSIADRPVETLSGGQGRRVALAAALTDDEAELLILDEPTNHLDIDGIDFLEQTLKAFRGGVVVVSHDRHLLDRLATRMVGLSRAGTLVVDGAYAEYLEARAADTDALAKAEASRKILARQELEWLRRGARARRRKPKARLTVAHATLDEIEQPTDREGDIALGEFGASRLGRRVIELHGVAGGRPDGPDLFSDVELSLDPRARLGVVGPNGAGKSTFLDVLAGRLAPRRGEVTHGATVRIGYFDQRGQALDPTSTVEEVVAGQGNRLEHRQVALLERFWFEPATHRAAVATLSGGEQRRLQLLALLSAEPNVLLLDEPTNDLDLDTLRALEDWIEGFEGAVIAVTHDRVFLERVIEHVVAIGDSGLAVIPPGDSVWEHASSQPRRATAAPKGTRAPTQERTEGAAKRRSPSTLRHLLQRAEGDLERAQQARDGLAQELAGEHDHEALAELGIRLAAAEDELAAAEESWLTLASEAESTSS